MSDDSDGENQEHKEQLRLKAKIAALEKMSMPISQSLLDSIDQIGESNRKITESLSFPRLRALFDNSQVESLKKIQESFQPKIDPEVLKGLKVTLDLQKKFAESIPKIELPELGDGLMESLPDYSKMNDQIEIAAKEKRQRQTMMEENSLEQTRILADMLERENITAQALNELLGGYQQNEMAKAIQGVGNQKIATSTLIVATLGVLLSGLLFFFQKPPVVNVAPPAVNVPQADFTPLIEELKNQNTNLIKLIEQKSATQLKEPKQGKAKLKKN